MSLFNTLSCSYLTTTISISDDSLFYRSTYFLIKKALGCNQSKWPWHSFICSVAPEDDQLPLTLSYWCSIYLLMIFFFVSLLYTDPHDHFNFYIPGWLFGIDLSLFLHKIFFILESFWNPTLNLVFGISFLIFDPIFGIHRKVIVCFLFVLSLLLLLQLRVFFFKVINYLL